MLTPYWPEQSPQLHRSFCQLLTFPTGGRLDGEDFAQRIVDGTLSSHSQWASADTMTLPSLWWNRDSLTSHLGGRRLVDSWLSYRIKEADTAVVDVVINSQIWSVLTYSERYAVLNQFGTAARDSGYSLRFLQGNSRNYRIAGLYVCDFNTESDSLAEQNVQTCSASLDAGLIVLLQRDLQAASERRQSPLATAEGVQSAETTQPPN
ncbi:MAG: hypothetical protein WBG38_11325 [Nodosilinea sp.]